MNRDTRRTRIILALLLLTSFTLISLDVRGAAVGQTLRDVGGTVFGPVERAVAGAVRPVGDAFSGVTSISKNRRRLDALRRENDALRLQARTGADDRKRAAELDGLLKVAGLGRYKVVMARTVAYGSAQSFSRTITIDAGSRDGVDKDMTVMASAGLVGRVVSVGPWTATVQLAVDPSARVGARLQGSRELGFVVGKGKDGFQLELFDAQAPIKTGDAVLTFGSPGGRPFVPGLPIGVVTSVQAAPGTLSRVATVQPFVDPTSLDTVAVVVQPPRTDPRDAILPAVPRPTVSSTPSPPVPGATPKGSASRRAGG